MNRLFAGAALAALLAAGVAGAQMPPPPPGHDMPGLPLKRADVPALIAKKFAELDTNHDGGVTEAEIRAARRAKGEAMMKAHREREFAMLDANHDGSLSRQEFTAPPPPPGEAKGPPPPPPPGGPGPHGRGMGPGFGMLMGGRAFEKADANQDGKVTLAEAQTAALAAFDKADTNHDGVLTQDEVRARFMSRMHRRHGPVGGGPGDDMPPPPPR